MADHNPSSRDRLLAVLDELRELLHRGDLSEQDKAVILQVGPMLMGIVRRLMGRWTPVNPTTLPPRKPGQPYPQLPKGWAVDWEDQKEAANA